MECHGAPKQTWSTEQTQPEGQNQHRECDISAPLLTVSLYPSQKFLKVTSGLLKTLQEVEITPWGSALLMQAAALP